MFWSGNYIVVRELNFLLKEKNVTLTQVLEADDILQECKADNLALIQFLTKPEILAELVTLITEEPPHDVELASQYRHASVACEVLTSHLSMLSERLSSDVQQMNRLCDFLNRHPPLNPLLASYFSKTIEMLLERGPKQDWYLYHIVCLRVLDFLKARRDFLPNLLRHISTSAIADIFKCFIRLDNLFNKVVMEWLDEHQFLESLIQIICGTYTPPELAPTPYPCPAPAPAPAPTAPAPPAPPAPPRATFRLKHNHVPDTGEAPPVEQQQEKEQKDAEENEILTPPPSPGAEGAEGAERAEGAEGAAGAAGAEGLATDREERVRRERIAEIASANAASLLCDIIMNDYSSDLGQIGGGGGGGGGAACGGGGGAAGGAGLVARVRSPWCVRLLLQSVFTSPSVVGEGGGGGGGRRSALVHGARVLAALTSEDYAQATACWEEDGEATADRATSHFPQLFEEARAATATGAVERALAPHLPLLHQALLVSPGGAGGAGGPGAVGAARIEVARLLAQLATSEREEVATTMITLDTPGALLELFLRYTENNFLHSAVLAYVTNALQNRCYQRQYADHLVVECDMLTRLMDVFEENEKKSSGEAGEAGEGGAGRGPGPAPRAGHTGHVTRLLHAAAQAPLPPPRTAAAAARWSYFREERLQPLIERLDKPLGGYYPSENNYDVDGMEDTTGGSYELNEASARAAAADEWSKGSAGVEGAEGAEGTEDIDYSSPTAQRLFEHLRMVCCVEPDGDGAGVRDGEGERQRDGEGRAEGEDYFASKNTFLELASQRFDDNMWDDQPECEGAEAEAEREREGEGEGEGEGVADPLREAPSPWESAAELTSTEAAADWAQFESEAFSEPLDPFSAATGAGAGAGAGTGRGAAGGPVPARGGDAADDDYWNFGWTSSGEAGTEAPGASSLERGLQQLSVGQLEAASAELANNLLTAMSAMTPDVIANIVNANMTPPTPPTPPTTRTDEER